MGSDGSGRTSGRPVFDLGKLRSVRPRDMAIRFALGAFISVAAGVIGILTGTRYGGVYLAFPAILPATLTLIQQKEGGFRADRDAEGAVIGGVALAAFAAVAWWTFGPLRFPVVAALTVSLVCWVAVALAGYALAVKLRPKLALDGRSDR